MKQFEGHEAKRRSRTSFRSRTLNVCGIYLNTFTNSSGNIGCLKSIRLFLIWCISEELNHLNMYLNVRRTEFNCVPRRIKGKMKVLHFIYKRHQGKIGKHQKAMYKKSFRQTVEVAVSVSPSLCAVKAASTQKLKKPTPYQIFLRISRRAVLFLHHF